MVDRIVPLAISHSPLAISVSAVLVTRRLPSSVLDKLRAAADVDLYVGDAPISADELRARVADKDALVCLLTDRIDASVIDAAPKLRVVSNVAVGYNNIDVAAARARRIAARAARGRHASSHRQTCAGAHEAICVSRQHRARTRRRRRGAGVGAGPASARRRRARRLRKRTGGSSRSAAARERAPRPSHGERHHRNAHRDGRSGRRKRACGAGWPAAAHSCMKNVGAVMRALAREIDGLELPAVEKISEDHQEDPFHVLIGTLLSARTQDRTTAAASARLFKAARTPHTMARLPVKRIERLIY